MDLLDWRLGLADFLFGDSWMPYKSPKFDNVLLLRDWFRIISLWAGVLRWI